MHNIINTAACEIFIEQEQMMHLNAKPTIHV